MMMQLSQKKNGKSSFRWHNEGDILEINLDLNEKTLSAKVNDKDFGVVFKKVSKKRYRFAISVCGGGGFEFCMM